MPIYQNIRSTFRRIRLGVKYRIKSKSIEYVNFIRNLHQYIRVSFLLSEKKVIFFHSGFGHLQNTETIRNIMNRKSFLSINSFDDRKHRNKLISESSVRWFGNHISISGNKLVLTPHYYFRRKDLNNNAKLVHILHSLMPLANIYEEFAFDELDFIVVPTPYHVNEFITLAKNRKQLSGKILWPAGYTKIDLVRSRINQKDSAGINQNNTNQKGHTSSTILIAPTLSNPFNFSFAFKDYEIIAIVSIIINQGNSVVFRPHPAQKSDLDLFFQKDLYERFSSSGKFRIDLEPDYFDSYRNSDLMITDYSGTGLTYSWGFEKPCIFLCEEIEIIKSAKIAFAQNLEDLILKIESLLGSESKLASESLFTNPIYNIDKSGEVIAEYIEYSLSNRIHPDWITL